jgi:hypothetical protein
VLADGRNAHLIQEDKKWWRQRLEQFFHVAKIWDTPPLLHVLVDAPKKVQAKYKMDKVQSR